jgi:hypothetical protein
MANQKYNGVVMKLFLITTFVLSLFLSNLTYTQNKIGNNTKEKVEAAAKLFLNSAAGGGMVSSDLIASESLDKFKDDMLSMALAYDSLGKSNAMMLLSADSIKSMSSVQVWDYMRNLSKTMKKQTFNVEWKIVKTEIKNNNAFVTYKVKDGETKILQLKKNNNKWKVVLSLTSIF